jgi:beta-1,4-mannooligosaccharide/beta-1,4-mannosyl-N-acetylglucosamine phosphorylase
MLLDLEDPSRVVGISKEPIMVPEPEYAYEMEGYRDHVLFPGGVIVEDNGEVKIYYGASDTVEALATCRLEDLLDACEPM